jgi:hypothetical protein
MMKKNVKWKFHYILALAELLSGRLSVRSISSVHGCKIEYLACFACCISLDSKSTCSSSGYFSRLDQVQDSTLSRYGRTFHALPTPTITHHTLYTQLICTNTPPSSAYRILRMTHPKRSLSIISYHQKQKQHHHRSAVKAPGTQKEDGKLRARRMNETGSKKASSSLFYFLYYTSLRTLHCICGVYKGSKAHSFEYHGGGRTGRMLCLLAVNSSCK